MIKAIQKIVLIVFLFQVTPIFSDSIYNFPLNKTNSVEFDKLTKKLSQKKDVSGIFKQEKRLISLKKPLKSEGAFQVSVDQIIWKTEKPFQSTIEINKKGLFQEAFGKRTQLSSITDPMMAQVMSIFISIFRGDKEKLQKEFELFFKKDQTGWRLGLLAKDTSLVKEILPEIELSGKENPERFFSKDKKGNELEIGLTTLK